MKYLIVGLGNIGDEYCQTRHNIGFMILDALAEASKYLFHHRTLRRCGPRTHQKQTAGVSQAVHIHEPVRQRRALLG